MASLSILLADFLRWFDDRDRDRDRDGDDLAVLRFAGYTNRAHRSSDVK